MSKKTKLEIDENEIDDELDIDSFLNDNLDFSQESKTKKRTPVLDVFDGTISGLKSKFTDRGFIGKVVRDSLPEQYGEVISVTDDISSNIADLYNDAVREVKPQLSQLAKKVDRLVPEENRFFKKITKKIVDVVGDESDYNRRSGSDNYQEASIANGIASVFDANNDINNQLKAKEAAENAIKENIETNRYTLTNKILGSISDSVSRLATYNDKITLAYQKKSLELQFRSYFVQSELLNVTNKYNDLFKVQNEAIIKNTGLPEYVKIKNSEKFKDLAQNKLFDSLHNSLFGDNKVIKDFKTNIGRSIKESIEGFKYGLEQANEGLDALATIKEQNEMLKEAGGKPMSSFKTLGAAGGSVFGDFIGDKVTPKIREKLEGTPEVSEFGYKVSDVIGNVKGYAKEAKSSDFILDNYYESGIKGTIAKVAQGFLDAIDTNDPSMTIKGESSRLEDGVNPSFFDNNTQKSIVEIIPGFLSRILNELKTTRTGVDDGLTKFDYDSNRFISHQEASSKIERVLSEGVDNSSYKYYTDKALDSILKDKELPKKQKEKIEAALTSISTKVMRYTPDNIRQTPEYGSLDSKTKKSLDKILDDLTVNTETPKKGQRQLSKVFSDIRNSTPNLKGHIAKFIKEGHGDILEEKGIATRNTELGREDEYKVNFDEYKRRLKEGRTLSDINAKENVSRVNPKDILKNILDSVKNTDIFKWSYKKGRGDEKEHIGPMARDVKDKIGTDASPEGRSIDLTTLNGKNMAAISALDEKIENIKAPDNNEILTSIHKDTTTIVELLEKHSNNDFYTSNDTSSSIKDNIFNRLTDSISTIFNTTKSVLTFGKDKIVKPILGTIGDISDKNKDSVGDAIKGLILKSIEIASSGMDLAKDIITSKLPAGWKQLHKLGTTIKDKLFDIVGAVDVYVKGIEAPLLSANLMRLGYYIDQTTGKVIKSIGDIKGPVINKAGEVVLTAKDIASGLIDNKGKSIRTPFEKIVLSGFNTVSKLFKAGKDVIGTGLSVGKSIFNKVTSFGGKHLPSINLGSSTAVGNYHDEKLYGVVVDIRNILLNKGKSKPPKRSKKDKSISEVTKSSISSIIPPSVSSTEHTTAEDNNPQYTSKTNIINTLKNKGKEGIEKAKEHITPIKEKAIKKIKDIKSKLTPKKDKSDKVGIIEALLSKYKPAWNDADGSGERDGSWKDRIKVLAERDKTKHGVASKADLGLRYKSDTNIIDTIFSGTKKLLGLMSEGIGGLFGMAGGLLGGGVTGFLGKVISKLGRLGAPIAGGISALGRVGNIGGVLEAGRSALVIGGTLLPGIAGSISAAVGITASAVGAILSSPVVLGAAAVGAVGYGLYKGYKYITRNNIDDFEEIRLRQYGLSNPKVNKTHNATVLQLESYLLDGNIGYRRGGGAYIIDKKVDIKELYSIFSIDESDKENTSKFLNWYQYRFKPFFLTHVTALLAVDKKLTLDKVHKLKDDQKLKFLNLIGFESGPYDRNISPFKNLPYLDTSSNGALTLIKNITLRTNSDVSSKVNEKDNKVIPDRVPSPIKQDDSKPIPKLDIPKPNSTYKFTQPQPDVEQDSFNKQLIPANQNTTSSSNSSLVEAIGGLKDGSSGMQYVNLSKGVKLDGIQPALLQNFTAMVQEYGESTGKKVTVTDGFRTREDQVAIKKKYGDGAATPGHSMHEFGLALDVDSKDLNALEGKGLMRKYGFTRPVGGEPWHTEPAGLQLSIPKAKSDPNWAADQIRNSIHKGGGGLGTLASAKKYSRDPVLAGSLLGSGGKLISPEGKELKIPDFGSGYSNNLSSQPALDTNSSFKTNSDKTDGSNSIASNDSQYASSLNTSKQYNPISASGGYAGSVNSVSSSQVSPDIESNTKATVLPDSKESVKKKIADISSKIGADPTVMQTFAAIESGLDPNAGSNSSSAKGLYQFTNSTWNEQLRSKGGKYGIKLDTPPTDIVASTILANDYLNTNKNIISSVKPNPNVADLYLTHFLGPGGARTFLATDPNESAAKVLPKAAKANRSIFYSGSEPLSVGTIYKNIVSKVVNKAKEFGISTANIVMPKVEAKSKSKDSNLHSTSGLGYISPLSSNKDTVKPTVGSNSGNPNKGLDYIGDNTTSSKNSSSDQNTTIGKKGIDGKTLPKNNAIVPSLPNNVIDITNRIKDKQNTSNVPYTTKPNLIADAQTSVNKVLPIAKDVSNIRSITNIPGIVTKSLSILPDINRDNIIPASNTQDTSGYVENTPPVRRPDIIPPSYQSVNMQPISANDNSVVMERITTDVESINSTLLQSLEVQKQMLIALQQMVTNASSKDREALHKAVSKQPVGDNQAKSTLPDSAIDLRRKVS